MADWVLQKFSLRNSGVIERTYKDEKDKDQTKKYLLDGNFSFDLHYSRGTNILKKIEVYYRYKNNLSDTNVYEKLLGTTDDKIAKTNQGAVLDTEDNWILSYNSSDIFNDFRYQSGNGVVLIGFRVKCYDRKLFGGSSLRLDKFFDFSKENYIYPVDYLRKVRNYTLYAYEYDINENGFRFHPNIRFTAAVDAERGLSLQKALITIEDPDTEEVFFQTMTNFSLSAYQQYTINDLNLEDVLQNYNKETIKVRIRYLCQGQYNADNVPIGNYRLSRYQSSIFTWKKRKTFNITNISQDGSLWANLDKEDSLVLNWEEKGEKYEDGIYKLKISNSAWQSVFSFSLLKDSSKTFQLTNDIFKTNLKTIEGKPISELYGQINNQFYDNYTIELFYLDKWDQRDLNHYSATGSLDVKIEDSNISFLGDFYYDDITSYTITTTGKTISKNFQNTNYAVYDDKLTLVVPQVIYWSRALLNDPDFSNLNVETKYYNGTISLETLPDKIQNWVQNYITNKSYKINIKIQPLLTFENDIIYGNITNGPIINLSAKQKLNCDIYTGTNEIYYIVNNFGTDETLEALLRDNTAYLKITFSDDSSTSIIYSQLLSNITEGRKFIIDYDALGLQSNKDYTVVFEVYLFDGAYCYIRKEISQWSYNFDRPTFSPRKNGVIINGIPGAQLKNNNFIEINALDEKKGISIIYFGETDAPVEGKIYYEPSDGKIHLSGFVVD